jgi:ATP-dependent helicase/nuclease subunit A
LWARLGEESLDPIEELLNEAQNFGRGHTPSLQNFLQWLIQSDKEIKRELDFGDQQKGGQVRILTVHASKGLEAPIVFLPDTTALPRTTDLSRLQWIENDVAIFMPHQPKFGAASTVWQSARSKQIQEYRRLLYVALTRAANQLYIGGWLEKKNEMAPDDSWYALVKKSLQPLHDETHIKAHENPIPEIVLADASLEANLTSFASPPVQPIHEPLPAWAIQPVDTPAHLITPIPLQGFNDPAATPDAAFARGRIIHRLLQSLPNLSPEKRGMALTRFLSQPRHNLSQAQRDEIAKEVSALINDKRFAPLFATTSLAEAPLTGKISGVPVFRQIDRLCMSGDEVWIVDYKTNRPPPSRVDDVPPAYRQQLEEYCVLLRDIYPDKKVRSFLLWTYTPRLMEVIF